MRKSLIIERREMLKSTTKLLKNPSAWNAGGATQTKLRSSLGWETRLQDFSVPTQARTTFRHLVLPCLADNVRIAAPLRVSGF